ncbi:MAG TPA: YfiR family protein [Rhodocyclaceae bacterium]|nr:YfiR family protein [Rhodocyclaceae bacterium]
MKALRLRRVDLAPALALCLWFGHNGATPAQTPLAESQVKAAFILNFARLVEWPERVFLSREAPVTICLLGRDTFGDALSALESRQVQGRPIKVRRNVTHDEARTCQVVFIAEADERHSGAAVRHLNKLPILTIGDIDGFIDTGGAIGLVTSDNRLQFEINRAALDQAQLKASAQLLKLARNLRDKK